jgi:nitrile hydratase subunit alpha
VSDAGGTARLEKWRATQEYLAWQLRCADQKVREFEAQGQQEKNRRKQSRAEQS